MEVKINNTVLSLIKGDITHEKVDVIANAANPRLSGGGGVDGAIHAAGGSSIMEECKKIGGCETGDIAVTGAGDLNAKHVIHCVGPTYQGDHREEKILKDIYRKCLKYTIENGLKTIAFPSISTGLYGYPVHMAAHSALSAIIYFLKKNEGLELVRFVLFSDKDLKTYSDALKGLEAKL